MASLSVRKLDDEVYAQLRMRSLKHRVSMEEEARTIITQAVAAPEKITEVFNQFFGERNGVDLEGLLEQRKPHQPMDFK